MGKLFRRIVCFLLGMIVGLTGTVASTAGTLYYLYGNVTVEKATVIDTGFAHSDHNPVSLTFTLNAD